MRAIAMATAVVALAAAGTAPAAAQETEGQLQRPALQLISQSPLLVRGSLFKNRERVRVTFQTGASRVVRVVRANRTGRFTVGSGTDVALDRCGDLLLVSAVGARGSRAWLKRPLPLCPPLPSLP